ncbi:hypothetical protein [Streptomyces sp. NPDC002994]|uniref:hypothetical protein n=1 Tax=Streptomyces sp. NPDC002994 TaxID=3154441 RepID=UPI0033B8132E
MFPVGVETVTVTAGASGYRTLDGDAYAGTIRFTPSVSRVTSATHGVIALGTVNATLNASGGFSETLLATDADDFNPSGWTYRVDEEFTNAPGRAYDISLPAGAPTVTLPAFSRVESSVGTVSSPAVLSVNGESGVVTLTPPDIGADPAGTAAAAVATHTADTTAVHGIPDTAALETAAGALAKIAAHAAAADPHGDRAWASGIFATITVVNTLTGTVTTLNGFLDDIFLRLAAIEQGTAFLAGVNTNIVNVASKHTLDGAGDKLGFHGVPSVAKQTVSGSRADGTALANLLTALATLGLITDGTTA